MIKFDWWICKKCGRQGNLLFVNRHECKPEGDSLNGAPELAPAK